MGRETKRELTDRVLKQIHDRAIKKWGYEPRSDRDLCKKIGVWDNTYRAWVTGTSAPRIDTLQTVAKNLGCEVWELLHPDPFRLHAALEKLRDVENRIKAEQ